jgi:hypothetical protein
MIMACMAGRVSDQRMNAEDQTGQRECSASAAQNAIGCRIF